MSLAGIISSGRLRDIRAMSPAEVEYVRNRVIDLWSDGMDTLDIAAVVGLHGAWCHRVIARHNAGQIKAGTKPEPKA